jgi:hypothetical protein
MARYTSSKSEFDASKDEELFSVSSKPGALARMQKLVVKVCRYNGGLPKVQMYRTSENGSMLKLGRLAQKELEVILPLLTEANEFIKVGDFPEQQPLWNDVQMGEGE